MRRHRGILTLVALLTLGGLSFGVGLELYRQYRLPDPEQADGDGLMRWLATRDLSEESADTRGKLMRRMEWFLDEQDSEEPFELNEVLDQLDEDQTERFWSNVSLLSKLWFLEHVERYHQLSEAERPVFLGAMFDRITTWGVLAWIPSDTGQGKRASADMAAGALIIRKMIQPWIDRQEAEDRQKTEQFLDGVANYLMAQQIRQHIRRLLGR